MSYPDTIKAGRMTVVRDACNGGTLQLLNAGGSVMQSVTLDNPAGAVVGPLLTFSGFPKAAAATIASSFAAPVASARFRSSASADVKTGLTVGLKSTAAPAWAGSTVYAVNDTRTNGANQYRVVSQTGASAASGGPTGTGSGIVDGGVVWAYLAPANADVKLASMVWGVGDSISIDAGPTITHAA